MRAVETEGSSVAEASARASERLGVPIEALAIEVLAGADADGMVRLRATLRQTAGVSRETDESDAVAVVRTILRHLDVDCAVTERHGDEGIVLEISGPDAALAIGRHGQTLDAMEHLVNLIVLRSSQGGPKVLLDAEGYRQRREEALRTAALRAAEQARETGRQIPLAAMAPRERRIVHLALQDQPGVETVSEGDGPTRHVVVVPTGAAPRR